MVRLHGLVDRDVLADRVARADDHPAELLGHVGMLGNAADHRPLEEMVSFTQRGPALDDDVAFQNALGTDRHVVLDNREGSDLNAVAKSCRGSDQRQRVNTHNGYLEAVERVLRIAPGGCASHSLSLTAFIGRRKPADLADYERTERIRHLFRSKHPGGALQIAKKGTKSRRKWLKWLSCCD